ncbi:uncharacterized protein BDZ99DRAFT_348871, partial [Mytilinidion resinicola]
IWLHDYHSAHGSAVGYNGQNQNEVRKSETWILAFEPGEENPFGEITIHSGSLAVEIKFVNHTTADPQYPSTEAPTEPRTINDTPIYFHDQLLGIGGFGEVHKVIRIRDGKVLAAKTFIPPANDKKTTKLGEKPA